MGYFGSQGKVKKNVLGFTHVDEQLCFSMFHSIFAFDFDSISGGPMSYFLDWGKF